MKNGERTTSNDEQATENRQQETTTRTTTDNDRGFSGLNLRGAERPPSPP